MEIEPQLSLDFKAEASLHTENILIKDSECGGTTTPQNHDVQQPVSHAAKKQTRQWAAWTRQEEESFFTALRQVGKNFEKITCRVQSKNKDQVRHYYYRLVRRMNKLLGPGLCLDAKNSKDTNAAMLRWWSLLEKYSCKASKLHLKPRRFKIFIETLENQLLKDRKKSKRKRPSQGENCSLTIPTTVSNQGRALGHDSHAIEFVLLESQNIQKLGPGKGSSVRRNVNVGTNRTNSKGESFPAKTVRQRRKPAGTASAAAYKRWEKAAIAGVSLVADAAEQLERTTTDKDVEHVQGTLGQECFNPIVKDGPPLPSSSPNLSSENNVQTSVKLKLQLFPIDDRTRRALELDNHNPHLELTLSTRKKISSVLEHLNRKWGNSSVASGELTLFPYFVQWENVLDCQRWTQDSVLSAGDVYALIGSPPIFRLRYGWFSNTGIVPATSQAPLVSSGIIINRGVNITDEEQIKDSAPAPSNEDQLVSGTENTGTEPSATGVSNEIIRCSSADANKNMPEPSDGAAIVSWDRTETGTGAIPKEGENKDEQQSGNQPSLSVRQWDDGLTNISVGDLLSEMSHDMVPNCLDPSLAGSSQCLQQIPFSSDSFDDAIAAHLYRYQNKTSFQPVLASVASSIWDAEETRDAFSFQKNAVLREEVQGASATTSSEASKQELPELRGPNDGNLLDEEPLHVNSVDQGTEDDNSAYGDPMDECPCDPPVVEDSEKDLDGLSDIYWPDSLDPLDLDVPSSRYHTEDLILSDSLSCFNRLLASSLDSFPNCSFGLDKKEAASTVEAAEPTPSFCSFGLDKKEAASTSTVEAEPTPSFSGFKVYSGQ